MNKSAIKFALLPIAALVLAGCSGVARVNTDSTAASAQIADQRTSLRDSIIASEKARVQAQEVNRPFISGNSQPLARDVAMPETLRRSLPVTALFQKSSVDLGLALSQLSSATGITITATPDALLPPSAFASKMGGTQAVSPVQAPSRVVLMADNKPLWTVLDDIARQASVSWRPVAGGAEFYRLETKIFYLSAIPQNASTSASLGRNGSANTAFDSQSKTSFETKEQNLIKGFGVTVEALLSIGGKVTLNSETQTIIVTDTKEALEQVEKFIKEQNRFMSRRVRVLIEAIEVVDKDSSEVGIDWNILYAVANQAISMATPTSLTTSQAGGVSLVNSPNFTRSNSSVVVKALNEVGTVVNRRSFPFLTTSGRPVTQAIRSTFNYVDQVQAPTVASSANTTSVAPTITQKDETVGTFITLVPTAKSDGTIFLSVSFDVTSAQPLVPFTVGSGASAVTVQQKTIDGTGVIQEVPIRSGQTVVIGGIETQTSQSTSRSLGAEIPVILGGSANSKISKSRMVLLVTAVTEEGI